MHYLLLCCFDEKRWAGLPAARRDEIMRDYQAWKQDLAQRGRYVTGARLQSTASATRVSATNGKPVVTDGPFAETKEQLGGYHLLDCRDLDEAIAHAQRIPTLPAGGVVEVRPLQSYG